MSSIMGTNPTPIKSIQTNIYDFSWILKAYCYSLEKRLKNKKFTKDLVVHLRWVRKYYDNYQLVFDKYFKLSNKVML